MKIAAALLLLVLESAFAGTCHTIYHSHERLKVQMMTIDPTDTPARSLEECTTIALSQLGKKRRVKNFVRNEVRVLTNVNYKFSNEFISAEGKAALKP